MWRKDRSRNTQSERVQNMAERIDYRQNRQGIYVPLHSWADINDALMYGEQLGKAARDNKQMTPQESKVYQTYRKIGSLFSTYHQALYQNATTYGASDKPLGTMSHRALREVARRSAIDAAIINARRIQVSHVAKRVIVEGKQKGFTVLNKRHSDPSFKNTPSVKKICQDIEDVIFNRVNKDVHGSGGFRDFMVKVVQDELIIDRKVMITMRDRKQRVLSYHTIPPDNVKPRLEVLLKYVPTPVNPYGIQRYSEADIDHAQREIFNRFGVDVSEAAYVQEIDNIVTGAWTQEECSVDITAPSNELDMAFYGVSCLERSLEVTYLLIQAFNANKEIFNQEMPDSLLMLHGEVDPVALEEFRYKIKAEGKRTRIGIMPTGDIGNSAEIMKVRDTPKDAEMVTLLHTQIALKCAFFRAHTSLLNFSDFGQGGKSVINNSGAGDAFKVDLAQEEGLGSLLENSAFWLTREVVEPNPEWQDYEVVVDLPDKQTEQELIEMWTAKTSSTHTIDAALAAQGQPTLAEQTGGRVKGDYINNQFFFQRMAAEQAEVEQTVQDLLPQEPGGQNGNGAPGKPQSQPGWTLGEDKKSVEKSWRLE